jgi:probable HAF family extracellular repeat protein
MVLMSGTGGASSQSYSVTSLSSSSGWVQPRAMNATGQVAFTEYDEVSGKYVAYFYDGATKHRIGLLSVNPPLFVTDSGQVVGYGHVGTAGCHPCSSHAFSWTKAEGIVDLTPDASSSYVVDINERGQVIGVYVAGNGRGGAFSWTQAGGMVDVGTLGGGGPRPTDVNERARWLAPPIRPGI